MTPEGKVKAAVKKLLDSLGDDCWYYMPVPMGMGRAGIPDFIACYKGVFYGIEAKAPGKRDSLTPWQHRELEAIYKAGGRNFVIDGVDALKAHFNAL